MFFRSGRCLLEPQLLPLDALATVAAVVAAAARAVMAVPVVWPVKAGRGWLCRFLVPGCCNCRGPPMAAYGWLWLPVTACGLG